jgi:hypothetical protein
VVVEALGVEIAFEEVGIAVAGVGAVPGGEAVAEGDYDGATVLWLRGRCRSGGGLRRIRSRLGLGGRFVAVASCEKGNPGSERDEAGTATSAHSFNLAGSGRGRAWVRVRGAR